MKPIDFHPFAGINNAHFQTLWPPLRRKISGVQYQRERIHTPDGDFLDLDWLKKDHRRVIILTHGLEGSTSSQYMLGTAKLFHEHDWDVLAWNCRSCSGEMNRAFRMYYHGDTEDITTVVNHARSLGYTTIALAGFSMGGNITMKYLGTLGDQAPSEVCGAICFSSPCDLESGANVLDRWDNWAYKRTFMQALARKMLVKNQHYPDRIDVSRLKQVRTWRDFDEWFSAPMCGYVNAEAFYLDSSSRYFVGGVRKPTLLVSAINDPILTPACFPTDVARGHQWFSVEITKQGGHCGFMERGYEYSWAERRALRFFNDILDEV
jgi:uncharacterized protein